MTTTKIFSMRATLAATAASALLVTGCANMTEGQRDTGIGAGIGAVVGGLIGGDAKGAAIGAGVGALGGYGWSRYMENKRVEMERATAGTGIQVSQTEDNQLRLQIPNDISFATNRADIQPRLRPVLDQFAQGLDQQRGMDVRVVGHADSTGSDAINDPLSLRRAESVRSYLIERGVDGRNIFTDGRGSHEPIASNATAEGRAQNRRVEVFLGERADAAQSNAPSSSQGNQPIGTVAR